MEEITKDTPILRSTEDERVVRLDGTYTGYIRETVACFDTHICKLVYFEEEEKAKTFQIPTETMAALARAFQNWQDDLQKKAEQEAEQEAALIAEAKKIIEDNPGIKLEERGKGSNTIWQVSVPDAGWEPAYPAYHAANLLMQVQNALEAWQNYLTECKKQDEALREALKLAATIPNIQLNEQAHEHGFHKKKWRIVVPGIYQAALRAFNGIQLYEQVKAAYVAWSNVQDEQVEEEETPDVAL